MKRYDLEFPLTHPDNQDRWPTPVNSPFGDESGLNQNFLAGFPYSSRRQPDLVKETYNFDTHFWDHFDELLDFKAQIGGGRDIFFSYSMNYQRWFPMVWRNATECKYPGVNTSLVSFPVVLQEVPEVDYPVAKLPTEPLSMITAHSWNKFLGTGTGGAWSKTVPAGSPNPSNSGFYWKATAAGNYATMLVDGNSLKVWAAGGDIEVSVDGEVVATASVTYTGTPEIIYNGLDTVTDAAPYDSGEVDSAGNAIMLVPRSNRRNHLVKVESLSATPMYIDVVEVVRPGRPAS